MTLDEALEKTDCRTTMVEHPTVVWLSERFEEFEKNSMAVSHIVMGTDAEKVLVEEWETMISFNGGRLLWGAKLSVRDDLKDGFWLVSLENHDERWSAKRYKVSEV